jgi:hypothetical protein
VQGVKEQGVHFHQDIKEMERRYQGQWTVNMMGDYFWTLPHEIPETPHKRNSNIHSLVGKRKRQYKAIE